MNMSNVTDTNFTVHLNETEVQRENFNLLQRKDNVGDDRNTAVTDKKQILLGTYERNVEWKKKQKITEKIPLDQQLLMLQNKLII